MEDLQKTKLIEQEKLIEAIKDIHDKGLLIESCTISFKTDGYSSNFAYIYISKEEFYRMYAGESVEQSTAGIMCKNILKMPSGFVIGVCCHGSVDYFQRTVTVGGE